jgi:RHS repeat-associated protein
MNSKSCSLVVAFSLFHSGAMCAELQSTPPSDGKAAVGADNTTRMERASRPVVRAADMERIARSGDEASGTAGSPVSQFNYQADLFTGRFSYTVPIVVAPGRQGAVPTLALSYNSAGANGWCGVGWGLETGFIQRETRFGVPVYWAPGATNPSTAYDSSKGFTANIGGVSATLVLVSATNANSVEFRQEVETAFLTYKLYNDNHWEVVDKSGNTFYLGETSTARMENNRSGWAAGAASSTFRWALNKVVDVNGNRTLLSYTKEGGMLYLTNIAYNGNINSPALSETHNVEFVLTNRADSNFTYQAGFRVDTSRLLSEIRIRAGGANVRKYLLTYTNSSSTLRSLLKSVTEFGSDFSTPLPSVSFNYQVKPFEFHPESDWGGVVSQGQTSTSWNSTRWTYGQYGYVTTIDIDGDGLPDRVMRTNAPAGTTSAFVVQRNTGSGFTNSYTWAINPTNATLEDATSRFYTFNDIPGVVLDFADINGDSRPDRVISRNPGYDKYEVALNPGLASPGFGSWGAQWAPVTNDVVGNWAWYLLRFGPGHYTDLMDINADGLIDRVSSRAVPPYDRFRIQFNTGSGFTRMVNWSPVSSQGQTSQGWNALSPVDTAGCTYVLFTDINGDSLPDRVMRKLLTPYTNFVVQFNNGAGFELEQNWGPLDSQGYTGNYAWNSPIGSDGYGVYASLLDINGDGLIDRVMRRSAAPFTNFVVQLNTGTGFSSPTNFGPIRSQGDTGPYWNGISGVQTGHTYVEMFDINGDGLPDRVMRKYSAPYDKFVVQLNKGPFPDLLCGVSNGIGGKLDVAYVPSTQWQNYDKDVVSDPWNEGAKAMLPFPVYTVRTITANDGFGASNTLTYANQGGFFDGKKREFRGFAKTRVTSPDGRRMEITYFHQGGGRDDSALGEYQDQTSIAKKGIPYRVDVLTTTNFTSWVTNRITLNKVEEYAVHTNGAYFPYISQTITMNSEDGVNFRSTAKQLAYDFATGNLTKDTSLGEVNSVNPATHGFSDVLSSDNVYTHITYASLGMIKNKPSSVKITSDSGGSTRLRESLFFYDARGNLTNNQVWLDTASAFISTGSTAYDQYGNPTSSTDAAGITSTVIYDTTNKQFPLTKITATFTNQFSYDLRSGAVVWAMDVNGMVASNVFDVFYRPKESWVSTNPYGPAVLWRSRMDYNLGGIVSGVSSNYIRQRVLDAVDLANGHESYTYSDGLGRAIQTRTEAETGEYRVANTFYDVLGNPYYQTLPYFSPGSGNTIVTGTKMGTRTEYDSLNRPVKVTPAVAMTFNGSGVPTNSLATGGDFGSPVGPVLTSFGIGTNPWAVMATDSEGKSKKSFSDAYGRVITIAEVAGGSTYDTSFDYDLVGNLYRVTDAASNQTLMSYDSLGRKTSMTDPDMGTWSYAYDNAGRMTQQIDARTNRIGFHYNDALGRMSAKVIYNSLGTLVASNTFTYDVSRKGSLHMVTDRQGWTTNSYDARGRVDKVARHLNITGQQYVTQTTYDDADRVKDLIYPNGAATIRYSYDTAGNLSNVASMAGTGTKEIFYTPGSYTAEGLLTSCTNGSVVTVYTYYTNSLRLKRLIASKGGTALQDNTYTYDTVSNIKSINDAVYTTGSPSGTLTNLLYDDLHRLVQLTSVGRGVKGFAYNPIGNVLTNGEYGAGLYQYGAKPHAVTNANGKAYAYDHCGNMTQRGTQTLVYDEENQLTGVYGAGLTNSYGYTEGGERLWRFNNSGSYTIWIGGLYELKDGKELCHVMAGGKRVATFEPLGGGPFAGIIGEERWVTANATILVWMNWPFSEGRTPKTMALFAMGVLLTACMLLRRAACEVSSLNVPRRWRLLPLTGSSRREETRTALGRKWSRLTSIAMGVKCAARVSGFRPRPLWQQFVTFVSLTALLLATMPTQVQAAQYHPVFYYYFGDHLGSSSVLTDRAGDEVQRYGYGAFGTETYQNNTSAFEVSNRYTGQTLDEDTGLYYYGARYYDPELGRFIQADTIVPSAANPQTLNRYAYCGNNPMKYVDPSGHDFGLSLLIGVVIGAALGGATSAATGGNIGMGVLTGAIGGLFGGLGAWAGSSAWATSTLGAVGGPLAGAVIGGATGGAVGAAVSGGNIGMGALTGAIAGGIAFGVSQLQIAIWGGNAPDSWGGVGFGFASSAAGGAIGGGVGSVLQGGNFGDGAAAGAIGGGIGFAIALMFMPGPKSNGRPLTKDEIELGKSVYGDSIDYSKVKVYGGKWRFFQPFGREMTPQGDIYTGGEQIADYTKMKPGTYKDYNGTLIHELQHVRQFQQGMNVVARGLYRNYNWNGPNFGRLKFSQYGIEQQAQMIEDYYYFRSQAPNAPALNIFRSVIPNIK